MRQFDRRLLIGMAAVAALATGATAGCTSEDAEPAAQASVPAPQRSVLLPGKPGETAQLVPPQAAPTADPFNDADADFLRMMIPHHRQAIELAGLASDRASNAQLKSFAERIAQTQGVEIAAYRGWLQERSLNEASAGHDHRTMAGMQSPERIAALTAATGDAFDRLFVEMMSEHHQGAITMSTDVLKNGQNPWVNQIARSVAHEQAVEIDRMREILTAA